MKKLLLAAAAATLISAPLAAHATAPRTCASIKAAGNNAADSALCTNDSGRVIGFGDYGYESDPVPARRPAAPSVVTVVRSWDNTGINDFGRSACHYSNRGSLEGYISQGYKVVATERIPFMGYGCSGVKYILSR